MRVGNVADGARAPRNDGGFALLSVMLILLVVGAMSMTAVALVGNASLINAYAGKQRGMEDAADAGLALGRAYVNAHPSSYPDSGYTELPPLAMVDADGNPIAGLTRRVYVGPTGISTGQYGVFGSIVSVVEDAAGNRVVRRGEMMQESFAKFAYFTDKETDSRGRPIYFAGGDQLFGPVHSNDVIRIMPGESPIFHGPVTTHRTIEDGRTAVFKQGVKERTPRIELPDVTELDKLDALAAPAYAAIVGDNLGDDGEATTRIEFVAIDLDGDGEVTGANEGFYKVYRSDDPGWVVASVPWSGLEDSPNCGHRHDIDGALYFYTAPEHDDPSFRDAAGHHLEGNANSVLKSRPHENPPRCYLGGSDSLSTNLTFRADDGRGHWVEWDGTWATSMPAAIASRPDRDYLVPLARLYNPEFKGVIHVTGKVAISGVLRGRITLAATGDIVIADDLEYASDPATATCSDILGLFAGGDIIVSDNSVNAPVNLDSHGADYRSYDATTDEVIQAVLLTLSSFTVENYDSGATRAEPCEGTWVGRGCLYVTGGIIQGRRGPVGQSAWSGATGYMKRYSYDQCAYTNPPPYYPTTGYFARSRYFEVDPTDFDVGTLFDRLSAG